MKNKLQFEKVYRCSVCGGMGAGNRMVDHVLSGNCDGTFSRKLRESERDGTYAGLEEEATLNTALLLKAEALKELKVSYQEMRAAIRLDIIEMKKINNSFLAEAYADYYTEII